MPRMLPAGTPSNEENPRAYRAQRKKAFRANATACSSSALHAAAGASDVDAIRKLVGHETDVEEDERRRMVDEEALATEPGDPVPQKLTALMVAAAHSRPAAMLLLAELGATPTLTDAQGGTYVLALLLLLLLLVLLVLLMLLVLLVCCCSRCPCCSRCSC